MPSQIYLHHTARVIVAAIVFNFDQYGDEGKKQEDMNEIIFRVAAHKPQQPKKYQYHSNRHGIPLLP